MSLYTISLRSPPMLRHPRFKESRSLYTQLHTLNKYYYRPLVKAGTGLEPAAYRSLVRHSSPLGHEV